MGEFNLSRSMQITVVERSNLTSQRSTLAENLRHPGVYGSESKLALIQDAYANDRVGETQTPFQGFRSSGLIKT